MRRYAGRVLLRRMFAFLRGDFSHPHQTGAKEPRRRAEDGERDSPTNPHADQRAQQRADGGRDGEAEDDGKRGHIGDG